MSGHLNDYDFTNNKKEKSLLEFNMFSVDDSFVSGDGSAFNSKDDVVSVEDLNNVSRNDLLFTSIDSYDNILSDNDLLNSVVDGVNFYNETMTLYGSDGRKDVQQNCNATLTDPDLDLLSLNSYQPTNRCDMFTDVCNSEIASMTENLENIVPNLNAVGDVSCNDVSTDYNETLLPPDHKISSNISSLSNIELENSISAKSSSNCTAKEDKGNLAEFLNFKGLKNGLTDNTRDTLMLNNNNKKYINSNSIVYCSPPKEDFGIVSLKNAKVISPRVIAVMPNHSSCVVPVKKFKNLNGVAAIRFIKHSNAGEYKQSSFKILNKDVNKNFINENVPKQKFEKINIQKIIDRQVNKAVQTCNKTGGFGISLVDGGQQNTHNRESENNILDEPTDKFKKPDLRNNKFVFHFSANARNASRGDFNFDELHKDNERIQYYTGIPKYSYFMALLNCLNLPTNKVIPPFQMLLLTLMKIRLNLDWMDLAYRFDKNVNIVKETFGITLYILNKCLSSLVHWPMQHCDSENYGLRTGMNLYVYGIKLNLYSRRSSYINQRVFICLSTSNNPIHYISTPILENEYNNRLGMIVSSGIKDNLVLGDEIIFDEEIDCLSVNGDRSAISVISRNCESFCDKPLNSSSFKIQNMKNTVSEIKKYKFLYDCITCGWEDESADEFTLYNDVVKVVCSLVNLCHVLPFCNVSVRNIIGDRNSMEIMLT